MRGFVYVGPGPYYVEGEHPHTEPSSDEEASHQTRESLSNEVMMTFSQLLQDQEVPIQVIKANFRTLLHKPLI